MITLSITKTERPRAKCEICGIKTREYKLSLGVSAYIKNPWRSLTTYYTCASCLPVLKYEVANNVKCELSKIMIPNDIVEDLQEEEVNIHAII